MKKFLLLLGTLFCAFNLSAQNYDSYLQKAYSALEEGNVEAAQADKKYVVSKNGRVTKKDGYYEYHFFPVRIFKK